MAKARYDSADRLIEDLSSRWAAWAERRVPHDLREAERRTDSIERRRPVALERAQEQRRELLKTTEIFDSFSGVGIDSPLEREGLPQRTLLHALALDRRLLAHVGLPRT